MIIKIDKKYHYFLKTFLLGLRFKIHCLGKILSISFSQFIFFQNRHETIIRI